MAETKPTGTVLVAGAGIAGIRSAIELAESGYCVILSDAAPATGGILAKLDYQFPSDHCGICRMLPLAGREFASEYCMRKGLFHENIEILPFTETTAVKGDSGNYTVELTHKARLVNTDICNTCMACIAVCPVEVPDAFNHGLTLRKAIYNAVPHNVPKLLLIDKSSCTECGECLKVCTPGAINLQEQDRIEERKVNAIILASGITLYNTRDHEDAKSYAVSKDVVSSLAFERILSATGTYTQEGMIKRPSDNKPAKKIAWIQCMGSRNHRQGRDYCSSICCMFALKEAVLAKEKGGSDTELTIFYMDMRTFGKGFQQYRDKVIAEHHIRLIRCRAQEVVKQPDGSLQIRYFDPATNAFAIESFDMVVLSTGQIPFQDHRKWADLLGCELAPSGLLATEPDNRSKLAGKQGIFLCGSLMNLTDISESMASGLAAAGAAAGFLHTLGIQSLPYVPVPEPNSNSKELPQLAVLLCTCHEQELHNIDKNLLMQQISAIHGVGMIHLMPDLCHEKSQQEALDILTKSHCNRLLIGACQPQMYKKKLKDLAKKAGFHSMLLTIMDFQGISRAELQPEGADLTKRIVTEITTAIASLKEAVALPGQSHEITQSVVVLGGGIGGMQAALSLARRDIPVHLIEKENRLGGFAGNNITRTIDNLFPTIMAQEMIRLVNENENITVHLNTQLEKSEGSLGSFESKISSSTPDNRTEKSYLHHGATIVTTGGQEGTATEYCYGQSKRIMSQFEMEKALEEETVDLEETEEIIMIQCVGLREKGKREYCSRVCCMWAIANALRIKEKKPDIRIIILYRDMMTYGFLEQYYTKAREKGVIFVPYELEERPTVTVVEDRPVIHFKESILNEEIEVTADYLVLSTGIIPEKSNSEVAQILDVPLNQDGFFAEADSKWRPVEFMKMGIFVAGAAHSPKPLPDVILQAEAAAQKAYTYLHAGQLQTSRITSSVKHAICIRCKLCIPVCPFQARSYNAMEHRIEIDAAACQACGMCAVTCRNSAAEVTGWSNRQMMASIDARLDELFTVS